jgi:hypothetical protein
MRSVLNGAGPRQERDGALRLAGHCLGALQVAVSLDVVLFSLSLAFT